MQISDAEILEALQRTGFPLEHRVTEAFRKQRWEVISGRYYVDSEDGKARELDLIAYRVQPLKTPRGEIELVSVVLVGCKKEAENTWAFMSRRAPTSDANADWCPLHSWTDEEPLSTFLRSTRASWKKDYEERVRKKAPGFYRVERDIFAMQVIAPPATPQPTKKPGAQAPPVKGATVKNDSPIFSAMSGVMSALHFELSLLPERMAKSRRAYVFHLAVVADAQMVDVQYEGSSPKVRQVSKILHLARFMVARKHLSALVYFSDASDLAGLVKKFDDLSKTDLEAMRDLVDQSYQAFLGNQDVMNMFAKRLQTEIRVTLNMGLRMLGRSERIEKIGFYRRDKELVLELDISDDSIDAIMSKCPERVEQIRALLRKETLYSGTLSIEPEIPF